MNFQLYGKLLVCLDNAIMLARQAELYDYMDELEDMYDRINNEYCELLAQTEDKDVCAKTI